MADAPLRGDVRERLAAAPDLARALARLVVARGGPRDLAAIRDGLGAAAELRRRLAGDAGRRGDRRCDGGAAAARPGDRRASLPQRSPRSCRSSSATAASSGRNTTRALDETRALRDESRRVVGGLQARYAEDTQVKSLKIRHNNVLGYFVEVTAQHGDKLMPPAVERDLHPPPDAGRDRSASPRRNSARWKRRSPTPPTARSASSWTSSSASPPAWSAAADDIKAAAHALAAIDVTAALATLAVERAYVRPEVDAGRDFVIVGGRHPVVEQALARDGGPFVANDCDLSPPQAGAAGRIYLITGPNMAGKSTYLRQNALIAVLAQIGSFVPARAARIGVVDRLFSRVGAADDLARGRSTFMVEMVETAAILNQATERSLVILDEIGRGTATFDGLSIAWAAIEHLHEQNRCRALFATHFHELTALAAKLPRLFNATVRVKEWQGDVVFLHEVVPGAADRSYGIQVAKLAGLPGKVIARAKLVLAELEAEDRMSPARHLIDDLPLFSAAARAAAPPADPAIEAVMKALAALHPDEMSPREAMEALYALKLLAKPRN